MKVKILQEFRDRADFKKVYPVGETHTFDNELAVSLIARGLAEDAEPSEEVVGKVQPIFLHEKETASATPKKKRSTKDN